MKKAASENPSATPVPSNLPPIPPEQFMVSLNEEILFENYVKTAGEYERTSIGFLHHSKFSTKDLTEGEDNY